MKKIQAVIFDMDGLMFDTESLFFIVHTEIAKRRGKKFDMTIQSKMMGKKPLDAARTLIEEVGLSETPEEISSEISAHYGKLLESDSEMLPGLMELLDLLDKKLLRKAIASGSNHAWIQTLLKKFGVEDRFEIITSGEDVKIAKPDPEIYRKTAEALKLDPDSCLVLEDSLNGIRSAKAAGCITVAVPSHFTKHQDFSESDYVVESLTDPMLEKIISYFLPLP